MATQTTSPRRTRPEAGPRPASPADARNEVHLVGRLSAPPVVKHLPSGAEVIQLRIVVDRPVTKRDPADSRKRSPTVDTIDVACWSAQSRRRALSCTGSEIVAVAGALRRRFWRTGAGVASRYEVEVDTLRVVKRAA